VPQPYDEQLSNSDIVNETASISVLHVDDEPDFADLAADMLEREDDRFAVASATSASVGLERLAVDDFDCIVSDYDMPGQNGIEFLEQVRDEFPDLPFILYTGKGSEEVASDAISAGVTDYLQKGSGTSQYAVLANRIRNAVENYYAQIELADREQRLNLFFEQSPLGVIEWNENFDVVRMNDAVEEILEYAEDNLAGRSWEAIVPESDRDAVAEVVADLLENKGGYHSINENVRKDGEQIICEWHNRVVTDENGDVVAIFSQFQEITERKEREDSLKQLHAATRDLMTATTAEGVATRSSETATQVLKIPMNGIHLYDAEADALAPVAWADRTDNMLDGSPPALPVDDSLAGQVYRTGEAQSFVPVHESDETFDPETPFRSECILPLGDYGVFILSSPEADAFDATDEALADVFAANVEVALDRVEQRQQLQRERDRLDEFAGIISHDLRNPLNVATGRLELAQGECDSDYLDDVAQAHNRMDALIDDILTLTREGKQVEDPEPVDLGVMIDGCWRNVETDETTLVTETEQTILAEPSRLKQLLENLFRNAVEHGGETVRVTAGDLDDGFYVADDGLGIPENERNEVFEAGYSTADEGTGFGLNIVQEIALAHGWEISVTDSETGGARFEITGVETAAA
jgi:PAS domain S-box-containing protein